MASDTIAMSNGGCTVAKKKGHHGTETHSKASKKDKKQNYKKESAISQSPAFTQVLKSQHNPIMKKQSTSQKSCSRTNFTATFTHPLTFLFGPNTSPTSTKILCLRS